MANETVITVRGVLGQDPELRFTPAGKPVANLSIASTPSRYDRSTSQWTGGTTMWMRASAWGDMAENVAESLRKGMGVIAQGRLGPVGCPHQRRAPLLDPTAGPDTTPGPATTPTHQNPAQP